MGLTHSMHTVRNQRPSTAVELVSGWAGLFGPAEADGGYLQSPYDLDHFANQASYVEDESIPSSEILSLDRSEGGRVLTWSVSGGRLEIVPLFTAAGASARVQLFAFDLTDSDLYPHKTRLVYPSRRERHGVALNIAYPLTLDDSGEPESIVLTCPEGAPVQSVELTDNGVAVSDPVTGAEYHVGRTEVFDTAGRSAVFAWVDSISDGELLLLARVI